jgi:uncharacterized protein YggT (Ycf19 family)
MADRTAEIRGLKLSKAIVWFVYAVVVAVEIVLAIAFFMLLFGANPTAPFAEWIYRATDRVMEPFRGIFGSVSPDGDDSVLDFSVLFAMFVYGIVALLVDGLVHWLDGKIKALKAAQLREGATRRGDEDGSRAGGSGTAPS